jgi:S1-C subfamily serine protease
VEPKFTRGEINSLSGIKDDARFFQISAPIQPGNSGGPLMDRSGNVIGIIELTARNLQNVNYALKSAHLLTFLKSISGIALVEPQATDAQGVDWVADAQTSIAIVLAF